MSTQAGRSWEDGRQLWATSFVSYRTPKEPGMSPFSLDYQGWYKLTVPLEA